MNSEIRISLPKRKIQQGFEGPVGSWWKIVTGIDPAQKGGYSLLGEFLACDRQWEVPPGAVLVNKEPVRVSKTRNEWCWTCFRITAKGPEGREHGRRELFSEPSSRFLTFRDQVRNALENPPKEVLAEIQERMQKSGGNSKNSPELSEERKLLGTIDAVQKSFALLDRQMRLLLPESTGTPESHKIWETLSTGRRKALQESSVSLAKAMKSWERFHKEIEIPEIPKIPKTPKTPETPEKRKNPPCP